MKGGYAFPFGRITGIRFKGYNLSLYFQAPPIEATKLIEILYEMEEDTKNSI